MKVFDCPKCGEKGWLIFTTTKNNSRKYPKIKHYITNNNPSRYSCSIKMNDIIHIHFDEKDEWHKEYEKIILEMDKISEDEYLYEKNNLPSYSELAPVRRKNLQKLEIIAKNHEGLLLKVGNILGKKGFLKYMIAYRIEWDFYNIPWTKRVYQVLSESGYPTPE